MAYLELVHLRGRVPGGMEFVDTQLDQRVLGAGTLLISSAGAPGDAAGVRDRSRSTYGLEVLVLARLPGVGVLVRRHRHPAICNGLALSRIQEHEDMRR